jgi:hypothetical protein
MPNPFAVLQHDGVHRADRPRVVRQFVQQWRDELLAGTGDAQAVVAHPLRRRQQVRQGISVKTQSGQVDQVRKDSENRAPRLPACAGRASGWDAGFDQADQKG